MCDCGHEHHLHSNSGPRTITESLRNDPTRTLPIRRRFEAEVNRRFDKLKRQIRYAVVTLDCFGLNPRPTANAELQPRAFEFMRSDQKVDAFMNWLNEMERKGILETFYREGGPFAGEEPWINVYIQSAYQRGIARAGEELRAKGYDVPSATGFHPEMIDPIAVAFNQPFHAERVALIYTRTFNELKGISAAMDQQISRVLALGIAEGRNPREIARLMLDRVDKIGRTRARTLARTEVVAAHHQATINTYEQWGVNGVTVEAEWLTAGYGVCPLCEDLSGRTFTLAQIRGMLPRHPNCRCCAIPVLRDNPRTTTRRRNAE